MKETDYSKIATEIESQLDSYDWLILDFVSNDVAVQVVLGIYITSDWIKGFGQDIPNTISIISSRDRISTIANGTSSYYKIEGGICLYESLSDDINSILVALEGSIARMQCNWV